MEGNRCESTGCRRDEEYSHSHTNLTQNTHARKQRRGSGLPPPEQAGFYLVGFQNSEQGGAGAAAERETFENQQESTTLTGLGSAACQPSAEAGAGPSLLAHL